MQVLARPRGINRRRGLGSCEESVLNYSQVTIQLHLPTYTRNTKTHTYIQNILYGVTANMSTPDLNMRWQDQNVVKKDGQWTVDG